MAVSEVAPVATKRVVVVADVEGSVVGESVHG